MHSLLLISCQVSSLRGCVGFFGNNQIPFKAISWWHWVNTLTGVKPLCVKNPGVAIKKKTNFFFFCGWQTVSGGSSKNYRSMHRTSKMDSFREVGHLKESKKTEMLPSVNLIVKHLWAASVCQVLWCSPCPSDLRGETASNCNTVLQSAWCWSPVPRLMN